MSERCTQPFDVVPLLLSHAEWLGYDVTAEIGGEGLCFIARHPTGETHVVRAGHAEDAYDAACALLTSIGVELDDI